MAIFGGIYYLRMYTDLDDGFNKDYLQLLNLSMLFLTSLKTLFFMRIFKNFGQFVQMLYLVIPEIKPILFLFLFFLIFFTICLSLLGMQNDDTVDGAQGMNNEEHTFLMLFRSDMSKLEMPMYGKLYKKDTTKSILDIYIIWAIYFGQLIFMFVIMLNFLIAVITETYEKVYQMSQ